MKINVKVVDIVDDSYRKVNDFVFSMGGTGVRVFLDSATITGKQLSGMFDDLLFRLELDETRECITFEEVDTDTLDSNMLMRLLSHIVNGTAVGYSERWIIKEYEFRDEDHHRCYLDIDYKTVFEKLQTFDELDAGGVTVSNDSLSVIDDILNDLGGDDDSIGGDDLTVEDDAEVKEYSYREQLKASMRAKIEEKKTELSNKLEKLEKSLSNLRFEISSKETQMDAILADIDNVKYRILDLNTEVELNGYYYHVSELIEGEVEILSDKQREVIKDVCDLFKVKSEKIINMLYGGYYKIFIGKKNDDGIIEKIDIRRGDFDDLAFVDSDGKFSIVDDYIKLSTKKTWHDIVDILAKLGYCSDNEFNKICGSNSYFTASELNSDDDINDDGINEEAMEYIDGYVCRTYDTPTNVYIIGCDNDGSSDYEIRDDYECAEVYSKDGAIDTLWTNGFLTIMVEDDFKTYFKNLSETCDYERGDDLGFDIIKLENYVGDIKVRLKLEDNGTVDYLNIEDYVGDFLSCQLPDNWEFHIIIEGNNYLKFDEYNPDEIFGDSDDEDNSDGGDVDEYITFDRSEVIGGSISRTMTDTTSLFSESLRLLQHKLNIAVSEERYEDASIIKKLMDDINMA